MEKIIIQPDGISAKRVNPYGKINPLYYKFNEDNPPHPTIGEWEPGKVLDATLVKAIRVVDQDEIFKEYRVVEIDEQYSHCHRHDVWFITETDKEIKPMEEINATILDCIKNDVPIAHICKEFGVSEDYINDLVFGKTPKLGEVTVKEMAIVDARKHAIDNGSGGDHVSEYFIKVASKYNGNPLVDVRHYENSNDRLSILKIDDKTVAYVAETRTEFNHVEFVFSELPTANTSAEAERDRIIKEVQKRLDYLNSCGSQNKQSENLIFAKIDILTDLITAIKK